MLVLVGQRRVGKSYILLDLKRWIEENEPDSHILYLDKEHKIGDEVMDADTLYRLATETLPSGERNYLLVDEVQNIDNYQDALRSLYAEQRCQIVVTGSNAYIYILPNLAHDLADATLKFRYTVFLTLSFLYFIIFRTRRIVCISICESEDCPV